MKAHKNSLPVIAALILMLLIFLVSTCVLNAQNYGYLIVVDYANGKTKVSKTVDINVINKSFEYHFKQEFDCAKELKSNVYFEHRNNHIRFYVEKKIIVKKNGKLKYKNIPKRK